jgi:hypothetical protein
MATSDLLARKIEDVAVQAPDRRPEHVQDVQRRHRPGWSNSQKDDTPSFLIARIPSKLDATVRD